MKKIIFTYITTVGLLFGYNFNGVWVNKSGAKYNDPIKLAIKGSYVTPFIKRGNKIYKLKQKRATNIGGKELFEAWGFGYKNLVLLIKPINRFKIKVIAKKIDTKAKKVVTKSFIFSNRQKVINSIKKSRFIGNWVGGNQFSALSRVAIRLENGKLLVKAWRPSNRGDIYIGSSIAKIRGNKLFATWHKDNLVINANFTGIGVINNRYKKLKVNISAKNLTNGLSNWQTMYLIKSKPNISKPQIRHIKVGPVDINLLINSY